jgi:thiosulfate/3-mercaptopyruvate sulfurtransferase
MPHTLVSALRATLIGLALTLGAAWAAQPLLTPAQLEPLQQAGNVRIIDTRPTEAYQKQHIAGAVSAPYGLWRGPASNPGQLPPTEVLAHLVQSLGLTPQTHAVIVYAGSNFTDFGSAARVYWTLKSLGAQNLSILNGGFAAWQKAGLPTSDQPVILTRSNWQPTFDPRWSATRTEVEGLLGQKDTLLVDARPLSFYEGKVAHPAAHARGTLPGAVDLDSHHFFAADSAALLDTAALRQAADALHESPAQKTVTFCNTGHWAATDWFVLSEVLQRPDVRMYPESMVDWTSAATPLPMQNEPGRVAQLSSQISTWLQRNLGARAQ